MAMATAPNRASVHGQALSFPYGSVGPYVLPVSVPAAFRTASVRVSAGNEFHVAIYPYRSAQPILAQCCDHGAYVSPGDRLPGACLALLNGITPWTSTAFPDRVFELKRFSLLLSNSLNDYEAHSGGLLVLIRFRRTARPVNAVMRHSPGLGICKFRFNASSGYHLPDRLD
ncbi:hypothetical protein PBRA_008098 [Plasmodiophora brassicae]|nr:hypothetical protein PBRA_008098 [Plasmodiophora brassicae]